MAAVDMDFFSGFLQGLQTSFIPFNLALILLGSLLGTLVGALPGIRAIHCVAIMTPLAYALKLPIESVLIFLLTIYHGCTYGERFSTILEDGNKHDISSLLTLTCCGSFFGGIVAVAGLIVTMPLLNLLDIGFGPAEYFALIIFAFSALSINTGEYPARTVVSTCLGLMMATIGIDSTTGVLRFTLSQPQLYDGIDFTTVVIGLFVVSQVFVLLETPDSPLPQLKIINSRPDWKKLFASRSVLLRGALSGFFVGMLPACGTAVASSLSEKIERSLPSSRPHQEPGKRKLLLARETANNAVTGGTMVPLLSLGIPGSRTSAILLGALLLYNITPGPNLLKQHDELIWIIVAAAGIANLILLLINLFLARFIIKAHTISKQVLTSCLLVLAFISAYSVHASSFSLLLVVILGLFGYLLQKYHYPLNPLLLGFVLGELLESNLRRALSISAGDLQILFASPTCKTLWLLSLLFFLLPLIQRLPGARRK